MTKKKLRLLFVLLSLFVVLGLVVYSAWSISLRWDKSEITEALESGRFTVGSSPCCSNPISVSGHIGQSEGRAFAVYRYGLYGSKLIVLFEESYPKTPEGRKAFAAFAFTGEGNARIKWYFCETESFNNYVRLATGDEDSE